MKSVLFAGLLVLAQFPFPALAGGMMDAAAPDMPETMGQTPLNESVNTTLGMGMGADMATALSPEQIGSLDSAALEAAGGLTPSVMPSSAIKQRTAARTPPSGTIAATAHAVYYQAAQSPEEVSAVSMESSDHQGAASQGRALAAGKKSPKNSAVRQLLKMAKSPEQAFAENVAKNANTIRVGKLGKLPAEHDSRTLRLKKYILSKLPAAPGTVDFSAKVKQWGMMLNDHIGDCTMAAGGHQIVQWTANAGTEQTPTDKQILTAYEKLSGYSPNKPGSDRGASILGALRYWRKNGIGGHKIGAFLSIDLDNLQHVKNAVWIFGGAYLGLRLPLSAQKQVVWDVPAGGATGNGAPGSWGGHAVPIAGFSSKGVLIVTWGGLKLMTWKFFQTYVDEAFAIISNDFLENGKTPNNGFDSATLKADLRAINQNGASTNTRRRRGS